MTHSVVIRRRRAREGIESAARYCADEAGTAIAPSFTDAIEAVIQHIAAHPASGSSRYADWTGHAGLRFWPVNGFPYLVFHSDRGEWLDVWRVLHVERDIPAFLREEK